MRLYMRDMLSTFEERMLGSSVQILELHAVLSASVLVPGGSKAMLKAALVCEANLAFIHVHLLRQRHRWNLVFHPSTLRRILRMPVGFHPSAFYSQLAIVACLVSAWLVASARLAEEFDEAVRSRHSLSFYSGQDCRYR